jgi:hypothetical protein
MAAARPDCHNERLHYPPAGLQSNRKKEQLHTLYAGLGLKKTPLYNFFNP